MNPPAVTAVPSTAPLRPSAQRGSAVGARVRYIGVDIARFLAIVGMMATHLIVVNVSESPFEQSAGQIAQTLTAGIAAPLFAVLGGVSAVFATRRLRQEGRVGAAIGAVMLRGAILILIGLLLGLVDSPIVVVLAYYGVAMLLVAPLIAAPSWLLAGLAVVLGVVGGPLNALARQGLATVNEGGSVTFEPLIADPLESIRALLLTGTYPAVTWCLYLLVGMLLARLFLSATAKNALGRVAAIVAVAGATTTVVAQFVSHWALNHLADLGFEAMPGVDPEVIRSLLIEPSFGAPFSSELWAQLVATPHTGSPLDVLNTVGISCAVIGLLVLLCDTRKRTRIGWPLQVLRSAGAAPLTLYTLHVIVTGVILSNVFADPSVIETGIPWWALGTGAFALQLGVVLMIGALLAAIGRRGPLEALVSQIVLLSTRGKRAVAAPAQI